MVPKYLSLKSFVYTYARELDSNNSVEGSGTFVISGSETAERGTTIASPKEHLIFIASSDLKA
jgi:hypothetical protein